MLPVSTVKKLRKLSVEEYLEAEKATEVRHEFIAGQVHAMVGASNIHNLIAGSLFARLRERVKHPCHVFMSDMKVRIDDDFYYPDLTISCSPVSEVSYYVTDPVVIIEILSPTTEIRDRVEKRIAYQKLEALTEYVLVSQEKIRAEVFRRSGQDWELEIHTVGDRVRLKAVGVEIPIEAIYQDVIKCLGKTE